MRPLSKIEQALTLMNQAFPITVATVLKFQQGSSPEAFRNALDNLQQRHPLLNATIKKNKNDFWFQQMKTVTPIPLEIADRKNDQDWLNVAQAEINKRIDHEPGPLMKAIYLPAANNEGKSELILLFHHAIADSEWLVSTINELLTIAGEYSENKIILPVQPEPLRLSPVMESVLPSAYKGFKLPFRVLPFIINQLREESIYKKRTKNLKDPPIPATSDNFLMNIFFSEETTTELVKWVRKKRLSINSVVSAAFLLAVWRQCFKGEDRLMRSINFANLRPYLSPPLSAENAGCFISLMRFMVSMNANITLEEIARQLNDKTIKALKKGDKFLFSKMSKTLIKQTLRNYDTRASSVLLSYAGPLLLKEQYGNIRLNGIHGFITNNHLGPVISGFGKFCFGSLSLDINFLSDETSEEDAVKLTNEIKFLIEEVINNK